MKACIVSEGGYPAYRGGLSEFAHWLVKTMKTVEFDVFSITPEECTKSVYEMPPNVDNVLIRPYVHGAFPRTFNLPEEVNEQLADSVRNILYGEPLDLDTICRLRKEYGVNKGWIKSKSCWNLMKGYYDECCSDRPFVEYFWTVFSLFSFLLDTVEVTSQLPRADVYHCLSTCYAGLAGAMGKVQYGSPLVVTEQGLFLLESRNELSRQDVSQWYRDQLMKFSESIVKTTYKYADAIVPPCHSHKTIEKGLGADITKVEVINNGIDLSRFTVGNHEKHTIPVIGLFARVVPIKGITFMIEAAKIVLDHYPAEFVVLGEIVDKEYHQQCLELVDKLGIGEHFKFIGHVNSLEWYRRVDVFTLTSLSEGVPYALLEAMSCGLPSVCTAVGGVPEIITEETGYVVPTERSDMLAEKYIELIRDDKLRLQMGRRATERAQARYGIEGMAEAFRNLYCRLIASNGKIPERTNERFSYPGTEIKVTNGTLTRMTLM